MTIADDFLAAMRAAPDDEGTQLVYADWLLIRGDVRGELIVLDLRERNTPGGMNDRAAVERLIELAAEHGFPRLPDDPDRDILPFVGGGSHPVQYSLDHADGHNYYLRWRYGFSIEIDDVTVLDTQLDLPANDWTQEETNVMLSIISEAIRAGTVQDLVFPNEAGIRAHRDYRRGRQPCYVLPDEFTLGRSPRARDWTLMARDFERWHALWRRLRSLRV